MIEYECPECFELMESPDELAGEVQECPTCGEDVPIPHPGEIVASPEDAYYEPPDDSSAASGESKVAAAIAIVLGTIAALGGLAVYFWTVYLFGTHWGEFWGIIAFFCPGLAQLVAMFYCIGWGVWFYIIAIAAFFSCLGGGATLMSSDIGRAAKVIMPSIALALIGTFAYFAYTHAVSPTRLTPELRERLEDDAIVAIAIIFSTTSEDPKDIASGAEAKSIFRKRTADYDKTTMAEVRRIVNSTLVLRRSLQKDVLQWLERWSTDRSRPFTLSDRSLRLHKALPQRIRDRTYLSDSPEIVQFKAMADNFPNPLPEKWREGFTEILESQWKLLAIAYKDLFGEPMPSFASDQ